MTDPDRNELDAVRAAFNEIAADYLGRVDDLPALNYDAAREALAGFQRSLPSEGIGAEAALRELYENGLPATGTTSGPRFFHWVVGGSTPAAMGADWLTSLLDNPSYAWVGSPLTVELERTEEMGADILKLCVEVGGVLTGEHGHTQNVFKGSTFVHCCGCQMVELPVSGICQNQTVIVIKQSKAGIDCLNGRNQSFFTVAELIVKVFEFELVCDRRHKISVCPPRQLERGQQKQT